MTCCERMLDAWPSLFEALEQRRGTAVAHSNPEQAPGVLGAIGEVKKVLVLGHDDTVLVRREFPDVAIRFGVESEVKDMNSVYPSRGEPPRQRSGQLVVHNEPHVPTSTT